MANTLYMTQEGDRWDTVAFKAYGDCTKDQIDKLKAANPYVTVKDVFEAGVQLNVPILEQVAENLDELLPPWKRSDPDISDMDESLNT